MTPAPPLVPAQPLLEVRKVWKSFGDNRVLRGVSLALAKGTILAVMGGSGTGKTVLLRIASGLIQPDAGGKDVFVHITAVQRAGLTGLSENQKISYELKQGRDGKMSADDLKAL